MSRQRARRATTLVFMAENKTQPTVVDPREFIASVEHPTRRADGEVLLELMEEVTGKPPVMWGPTIVGFDEYFYRYDSGHEGTAPMVGFSPRKASLSLYGIKEAPESAELLAKLGKHKTAVACVYVNKLADIDMEVLKELVRVGHRHYAEVLDQSADR